MRYVQAGDKGVSIKLHPDCEDKIYTDATDDNRDVAIVKGRVIRVDEPTGRMDQALRTPSYGDGVAVRKHPLLVETDEAPNYFGESEVKVPENKDEITEGDLHKLAAAKGLKLVRVDREADAVDVAIDDPKAGKEAPKSTLGSSTDTIDSATKPGKK